MTTTTIDQREPLVNRADKILIAQAVAATVVALTVILLIAAQPAAVIARVDALTASGLIAVMLAVYSVVLTIGAAWHKAYTRRPMPRRQTGHRRNPAPAVRANDGHTRAMRAVPAEPWTPPVAPDAPERTPLDETRIDDGLIPAHWAVEAGQAASSQATS